MNILVSCKSDDSKVIAYAERRAAAGDEIVFRAAGEDAADYFADEIVMPANWPELEQVRRQFLADSILVTIIGVDAKPSEGDDDLA